MPQAAYHLYRPAKPATDVVFASPHSCSAYPAAFLAQSCLDSHTIRSSEDAFVDLLFECAPAYGAPLLCAGVPRAYVDLNRSRDELDPALIEGARRHGHNPRVASGLGVVPRVVANGRPIYRGKLTLQEARDRIETYWAPYHTALQGLLDEAHLAHGRAILLDCHSMPHEAMDGVARSGAKRPEIVLGDRFGAAASSEIVDRIEAAFAAAGLVVARNAPFAGAYVTQAYGRPSRNQHALQIEIDRGLYMDETLVRPTAGFGPLKRLLRQVVAEILGAEQSELPMAAE